MSLNVLKAWIKWSFALFNVFFICFTVVVLIQNLGEFEHVAEPGFISAAATC